MVQILLLRLAVELGGVHSPIFSILAGGEIGRRSVQVFLFRPGSDWEELRNSKNQRQAWIRSLIHQIYLFFD